MASARSISGSSLCGRRVQARVSRNAVSSRGRLVVRNLFTGIVQGTAVVRAVQDRHDKLSWAGDQAVSFRTIQVELPAERSQGVQIGASVAINGTCLTVNRADGNVLTFDVIEETLRRTNLGSLQPGSSCNFERSVRYGEEVGGHTVSGHVQTCATVAGIARTESNQRWQLQLRDAKLIKYVLPKGFVGVNGCSLTVGEVGPDWFSVYLIPETLRATTFGVMAEGDVVNIEVDAQTVAIVDTVERVVRDYLPKAAGAGSTNGAQS